jgi:molybdopterin-synthase adenylyltransferase
MSQYSRQIKIAGIGKQGQEKITDASIAIIGLGGIGVPILTYLAAAGIGEIMLIDDDLVEESNLARQVIYKKSDIGNFKVDVAYDYILRHFPSCKILPVNKRFVAIDDHVIPKQYQYIIDATDNFKTRFLIADYCHKHAKILFSGALQEATGYYGVYKSGIDKNLPCFRCMHQKMNKVTDERACFNQGVLGPAVATIGTMIATELLKEVTGFGADIAGKLVNIDFLRNKHRVIKLSKDSECEFC